MLFRSAKIRLMGASAAALTARLCISPSMAQTATDSAAAVPPTPAQESVSAEEIVVTGSRITNSGFTAPTPVTVVGAAEIARQGATSISEVLNQVPSFRAQSTSATTAIFASNIGASTADLRGLGANRTLVLIDSRRVVAATTQGGSFTPANVVDLNMIPTSLIARSEVVTGGASAQYGSDAVAGVVNIILDTKLTGFRGSVQYGQSDYGDGKEYAASAAWGMNLGDRGHFIIGGDYSNNKGTGDCFTRDWCANGNNQVTNTSRTNGVPAVNILPNTTNATASRNGIITTGPLAGNEFSPDGQSLIRHNYGTYYNVGLFQSGGGDGRNAFYENFPIIAPVTRYATMAHVNYDLTDNVTAFGEVSYAHVKGRTVGSQTRDFAPPGITIQRTNPFLPASIVAAMGATTSFLMGRIGDDLGAAYSRVNRSTFRGVAGLNGKIGENWKWDAYYQYGRTNYHQKQYNTRINDNFTNAVNAVRNASGQIVCGINADANPANDDPNCSPLNLFGENHFSAQAKAYAFGTATQDTRISQHVAAATVTGTIVDLPAGPLSLAVGGEYRQDGAKGVADPISLALRFYTSPGAPIAGTIKVKEGFAEVDVPLLKDMALAHALDLRAAIRVTDYSTSGSVTSWKIGGTYEPVSQLKLRVTQSRDIRAPNIFELYGPRQTSFQSVLDPAKGGANVLPLTILGGNRNLVPETAKTFTVGAVLQPDFWGLNRLRFSVDYYDIKLKNAIAVLGSQTIVNLCQAGNATLCGSVVRDAANNIVSVSNTNLNLNRLNTRGLDFELAYSTPLDDAIPGVPGNLSIRALATKVMRLTTIDPTGTAIDRSGMVGSPVSTASGLPKWQGSMFLTYTNGPFSGTMQFRYVGAGVRDVTLVGPDDPRYGTYLTAATCPAPLQGGCTVNINHVPAYTYMNINAQYAIVDNGSHKVELFGVISNLFNTDPPNYLPSSFGPTNNVLYDVMGRMYRVGVRVTF